MVTARRNLESSLLTSRGPLPSGNSSRRCWISIVAFAGALTALALLVVLIDGGGDGGDGSSSVVLRSTGGSEIVESEVGVVAADDGMCSEIGASMLRMGGHAVDAAAAAALCGGVRHPMSSGIGGGCFIVLRSSSAKAEAFDCRETAPAAASQNMYDNDPSAMSIGGLAMGIPGELAGLHAAWSKYGRLPWETLFQPAIKLAREGFLVEPYLAMSFKNYEGKIMANPGLRAVFAPNGKLLQLNDTCYNPQLARTLETIAREGPQAFYNGNIGESFIEDVRRAGGIATMDDMRNYRIKVTDVVSADVMGYTILGMPPPSSGTVGIAMVLNILESYKTPDAVKGLLGLHRLIEAVKHMYSIRMNLGDPDFVNITRYMEDMLSPSFADQIRRQIRDNTTFDPSYYLARWSQLSDHGTTHISVIDAERNAVSMTSTVNYYFGAMLSASTGIVVNDEMADFSTPTQATVDSLPPAPSNFIEANKRPLSSMTPLIILKDNELAGVIGASGGIHIVPALVQVFINHFVFGMDPLKSVQHPRFYHTLIPNVVRYENWTALDGEKFVFSEAAKEFLKQRHHQLQNVSGATAVCQFVVQNLKQPVSNLRQRERNNDGVFHGILTAVSDPRKDGRPAGV